MTKTDHSISSIALSFDLLLKNIDSVISKSNKNTARTKLGRYKKMLANIESMDLISQAKLLRIMTQYNILNELFKPDSKIKYKDTAIDFIIKGQAALDDEGEQYNDSFFELSMAIRFSKALDEPVEIDMTGVCDIIVDNKLAIECKYIHGKNRIFDNIHAAESQIKRRVAENQATHGIVAIDLSNLIESDEVKFFVDYIFVEFCKNYKQIESNDQLITKSVVADFNFSKIVGIYAGHVMEMIFHANFIQKRKNPILSESTWAVVYQMNGSLYFKYEDNEPIGVPIRVMSYYINSSLSLERKNDIERVIRSLQTGF